MVLIFMGTPAFAVPSLHALLQTSHQVAAVFSQPDKRKGRGLKMVSSPVSLLARSREVPVFQPHTLKDEGLVTTIASFAPDLIVVVAYGKILPASILTIPRLGCVNLHASLLPRYRGAAPIQWSLIRGETISGVTTMLMDEGMDTGPILLQEMVPVELRDTAGSLGERLARLGASLLVRTIGDLEFGRIRPTPQNAAEVTYAPRLTKEDGILRWAEPAVDLCNRVRGLTPRPGAVTFYRGQQLKVLSCSALEGGKEETPGQILALVAEGIVVQGGDRPVLVENVQPAGKSPMAARAYVLGHRLAAGERFEEGP